MQPKAPKSLISACQMACTASILLFGYEMIRSASNSLFKADYGVEHLPVVMALVPIFLIPVLVAYSRSLDYFGPKRTLAGSGLFSSLAIYCCYLGIENEIKVASAMLYLVRESYAVLLIEQAWSFLNSTLSPSEAKRYNGLVLAISSIGAILGGFWVHLASQLIGTKQLVMYASFTCLPIAIIGSLAYPAKTKPSPHKNNSSVKDPFSIAIFKKQPILICILLMIIFSQVYSTVLALNFQELLQFEKPDLDEQTASSGLFFALLNALSFIFQVFVSPWMLKRWSIQKIHALIPSIHILMCLLSLLSPSYLTAAWSLAVFKSLDYSIFRSAKEILYMPMPFEARYKAKKIIDVLMFRVSKGTTSVTISIITKLGYAWSSVGYMIIGLLSVILWFTASTPISSHNKSAKRFLRKV